MSNITEKELKKISRLSRMHIDQTEEEFFIKQTEKIINILSLVGEVDTNGISPTISITPGTLSMRRDEVIIQNNEQDILQNAPKSAYNCFIVPKVVE